MTTQPAPEPIKLTDEMREAVNGALANGTPVILGYVDASGQPNLSFRGTAQVFSDHQVAVWARNPEGGLPHALAQNPRVTLLYRNPQTRMTLNFQGRGHVESAEDVRSRVFENSPEVERNLDPERKGAAIIVDLDRVTGFAGGNRFTMQRQ